MTTDLTDVVLRAVTVPVAPDEVFALFTRRFGDIKPPEHNLLDVPIAETVLEPRVGGSIVDRGIDGSECCWARILVFDPPRRLVFSWDIDLTWQLQTDPDRASEVEVRFVTEGASSTRVEIEHRHLGRHGPGWDAMRDSVDSEQGWPLYLDRVVALVTDGER